jgi:sugar/nucleoside kinase (ribokinase family)
MKPASPQHRTMSIGGATFDLFVSTDREVTQIAGTEAFVLPLGDKIWLPTVKGCFGGGAANTSVGLARLGCAASFCGIVADDQWGGQIFENLKAEGVSTDAATMVENESSSFSLVLSSPAGERVILAHQGTSRHLHDVTFDRESAATVGWVYLNHIHADSCVIENDLIAILTAEPHPCLTWNPGGCQIDAGLREKNNRLLLKHTKLLLLNKEEALAFSQTKSIPEALKALSAMGTDVVCITDGKNGSFATDGKQVYFCGAPAVKVVDTTGAGDAFGTGVTWGLLSGKDLPKSLQAGTINAMSVVGAVGAQAGLLTDIEMNSKLETLQIPVEVSSLQAA